MPTAHHSKLYAPQQLGIADEVPSSAQTLSAREGTVILNADLSNDDSFRPWLPEFVMDCLQEFKSVMALF
jgi:hypothetical protein